jgi:adenylate kinase family enzyme
MLRRVSQEANRLIRDAWCRFIGNLYVGKGTHSAKMLARFCMCHLSTGDLLREEVRSGSEFG